MKSIYRLAESIGYPETVPAGAASFTFLVDGAQVAAEEADGRLRLSHRLSDDPADLPRLAACAAGRMLREEAAPACDEEGAFLWQDAPADAGEHALRRLFETFCDSCDWWRERVEAPREGDSEGPPANEMRILP